LFPIDYKFFAVVMYYRMQIKVAIIVGFEVRGAHEFFTWKFYQ